MDQTVYLIDGHAQLYRAFYAVEGLRSPDGKPTGAVFGFTRMIQDIIKKHNPDAIVAVFDSPGPTFRHEMYAEYKANRKPTPPELVSQIPDVHEIVTAYKIPLYTLPGFEADDLLGTFSLQAVNAGWQVVIVSGDKDCAQLLTRGVRIFDPQKNVFTDYDGFINEKGIPPEKLTDLMGLWGDTADNIPGVPGIGEKIGLQLIQQYGSLDNLLDHSDEIKGKRGEVLRANRDQALLSRTLAVINTNAPIQIDLVAARSAEPNVAKLRELFKTFGFTSLMRQLDEVEQRPPESVDYRLVDSEEKFESFLTELAVQSFVAIDTETTALDPMKSQLVGISVSWKAGEGYYLPFMGPPGEDVLPASALGRLKRILENPKPAKTGHNIKFDDLVLRRCGIRIAGVEFDSLIASSLTGGHLMEHGLKTLAERHYHVAMTQIDELIGSGKNQLTMDSVPVETVSPYAAADADISFRLAGTLGNVLEEQGNAALFRDVELPLSRVLTDMQETGILIDCGLLAEQSAELSGMLDNLTKEIHDLAGHEFNVASPKQLAKVLFEEMGFPVTRKTTTGPSTDESALQQLANLHNSEIAGRVLEYRMYAKLKNTYLDALPDMVNPQTRRLHTTFSQTRTATGRLASSEPNLQNIPVRSERGRAVRAAFIPEPGWKLLSADYSQIELRFLAHFSEDKALLDAFAAGQDIHLVVAAEVNGIKPDMVTKDQRSAAKAVNFGIIYGQTAHGLAEGTGMSRFAAQHFIDRYYERFPRIGEWMGSAIEKARSEGGVSTILGRWREIPEIKSSNKAKVARGEREAINTIMQGSAADLIKVAMVNLSRRLRENFQARMLLQIHDELLFEAPPDEIPSLREMIHKEMEGALPLKVAITVDVGVGDNWLDAK